jgi:putative phosphoesterase
MRVAVVSDTHAPRRWRTCPPAVAECLAGVDLILHAGDVCVPAVLDELSAFAPVRAVLGNNDGPEVAAWGVPETQQFEVDGVRIAMIHDSGSSSGRWRRMRHRFPHADVVVFGHSHVPMDVEQDGLRLFNPGSPTDRRTQAHGTLGLLEIAEGRVVASRIVPVG